MNAIVYRTCMAAAGLIAGIGALAFAFAVFAPIVGFGEREAFVFFRAWGISRSQTAGTGLGMLIASIVAGGTVAVRHGAPWAAHLLQPLNRFRHRHRHRIEGFAQWFDVLWLRVNRNWVVTALLAPFALYIVALWIIAMPDGPWLAPDTQGYIIFFSQRTFFYPVFLRTVAALFDDPNAAVAIQLLAGLGGTVFFAEAAQRLLRNALITVPAGVFLMFNWPNLEHAFFLLTDYLFYAMLCLHLGMVLLAVRSMTPGRLAGVGITAGLAIIVRPAGVFLIGVVVFFLLYRPREWRRIMIALALPLMVLCGLQMAAHKAMFGYAGLSNNGGYGTLSNTGLLLEPDTPFDHPEVVRRVIEVTRPYREEIEAQPGFRKRVIQNMTSSNYIIGYSSRAIVEYGRETGLLVPIDESGKNRLVAWFNDLSPLNRAYAKLGASNGAHWHWMNEMAVRLGFAAHLHNVSGTVSMTLEKLVFGWQWVLANFYPDDQFVLPHRVMKPEAPRIGFGGPAPEPVTTEAWTSMVGGFNWIAKWFSRLDLVFPSPVLVLVAGIAVLYLFGGYLFRPNTMPPTIAALAYFAGCVFVFHLEVNLGSIPVPRLLTPVAPAAMVLYFSPLILFFRWLAGGRWAPTARTGP